MLNQMLSFPLTQIHIFSDKNDKVINWSQETHAITPYTDFEHINEKTISWQTAFQDQRLWAYIRLMNLESQEVGMVNLFLTLNQTQYVMSVLANTLNRKFEIKDIKYLVDEKDLDDLPSKSVDANSKDPDPSPFKCNLDMTKVKQSQQQETYITERATKCKSKKWNKTLCYLDKHEIVYRKIENRSNIFMHLCCYKLSNPTS